MAYLIDPEPPESFEYLTNTEQPAWIWGIDRLKFVWANKAGLEFWDEVDVDSLASRHFDRAMPGIQLIRSLASRSLQADSEKFSFVFWPDSGTQTVICRCTRAEIAPDTPGLLLVADKELPGKRHDNPDDSRDLHLSPVEAAAYSRLKRALDIEQREQDNQADNRTAAWTGSRPANDLTNQEDLETLNKIASMIQSSDKLTDGIARTGSQQKLSTRNQGDLPPGIRRPSDDMESPTQINLHGDDRPSGENIESVDLLTQVNHEIRTPLSSIIGFAEIMKDERFGPVSNPRYKEYLQNIYDSAHHILSLVNEILDQSKQSTEQATPEFEAVDLNTLVNQCVSSMLPQIRDKQLFVRPVLSQWIPNIRADQRSIKQILLNLLSNSIKFTDPGGQIFVSTLQSDGESITLQVADTGIGMTQEQIKKALKPFGQVNDTDRNSPGTGLGLPITKSLAEANGAVFQLSSSPDDGTCVEIIFPVSPRDETSK